MNKKLIAGILGGFTILAAGAGVSHAETSSVTVTGSANVSLQTEIQSLLSQIQALQEKVAQIAQTPTVTGSAGVSASTSGSISTSGPVWCHTFSGDLSVGSGGPEVTALQTALQNQGIQVSVNGAFGAQTAAAVSAFQTRYAASVLAPIGLTNATGYVGAATRAQLNNLFRCTQVGPNAIPSSAQGGNNYVGPTAVPPPSANTSVENNTSYSVTTTVSPGSSNSGANVGPHITSISPSSGAIGDMVTISGSGFAPTGNVIEFGGLLVSTSSVVSADGSAITFIVPTTIYASCSALQICPLGTGISVNPNTTYQVYVASNGTLSNSMPFMVMAPTAQKATAVHTAGGITVIPGATY